MSEQGLRARLFSKAFELFAEKGFNQVELTDVAEGIGEETAAIQALFPSKEALILSTGKWKMEMIAKEVDLVVNMDLPIIEKLAKYLEVMHQCLSEASYNVAIGMFIWQEGFANTMDEYLKEAVYGRFSKLMEEATMQWMLRDDVDAAGALYKYWDMLSSILAVSMSDQTPLEISPEKPINEVVCNEIIRVYQAVLKQEASEELNSLLAQHPNLSGICA